MQGTWVQSLVGERRSHVMPGVTKQGKKRKKIKTVSEECRGRCFRNPFCLVVTDGPWTGILIRVQEIMGGGAGIEEKRKLKGQVWAPSSTSSRSGLSSVSQSQQFPFIGNLSSLQRGELGERTLRNDKCSSAGLQQPLCRSSRGPGESGFSPRLLPALIRLSSSSETVDSGTDLDFSFREESQSRPTAPQQTA